MNLVVTLLVVASQRHLNVIRITIVVISLMKPVVKMLHAIPESTPAKMAVVFRKHGNVTPKMIAETEVMKGISAKRKHVPIIR